jgi:hypothetical protein
VLLRGRDKGLKSVSEIQVKDYRDKMGARIPPVRRLFALNEEISALTRLVVGLGGLELSANHAVFIEPVSGP